MTQPSDVIDEAYRWLGARETPDGSNIVPGITDWWPMQGAWCACFVSRVFWNAGLALGPYFAPDHAGFLWCSDGADWFRNQGRTLPSSEAQPGDVLMFEWGSTAGGYDHVGICVANLGWGLTTIEGNTSNQVMVHTRYYSEIPEACRPAWSEPAPPPSNRSARMNDCITMPPDHPVTPNRGVEFTVALGVVAHRWELSPQNNHAPDQWSPWQTIVVPSPGAAPGAPIDSVSARVNGWHCCEILVWHSDNVNHKFRAWQTSPGGIWDGWLDVP